MCVILIIVKKMFYHSHVSYETWTQSVSRFHSCSIPTLGTSYVSTTSNTLTNRLEVLLLLTQTGVSRKCFIEKIMFKIMMPRSLSWKRKAIHAIDVARCLATLITGTSILNTLDVLITEIGNSPVLYVLDHLRNEIDYGYIFYMFTRIIVPTVVVSVEKLSVNPVVSIRCIVQLGVRNIFVCILVNDPTNVHSVLRFLMTLLSISFLVLLMTLEIRGLKLMDIGINLTHQNCLGFSIEFKFEELKDHSRMCTSLSSRQISVLLLASMVALACGNVKRPSYWTR
uniref:G_PROTEIN_RECEP_F1_2 domain-containing protein n=1 Tax=Heterorhabditis bacteriophora TaxID=37862 RepID=A0A1I7WGA8_HETBA